MTPSKLAQDAALLVFGGLMALGLAGIVWTLWSRNVDGDWQCRCHDRDGDPFVHPKHMPSCWRCGERAP